MADPTPIDHAAPVLAGEPTISDAQRADLWDAFQTKNADELTQHLQTLAVPDDFKQRLLDAKVKSIPAADPLDKTTAIMTKMSKIDPQVLDLAENHPNVLKMMVSAANPPEKGPTKAAGEGTSKPKGNTQKQPAEPAPLQQPPRTDGSEHLPPIPAGHHRVLASDSSIHDIPAEHLEDARAIDPNMHVLNP
jgi:hypothetical protein